MAENNTPNSIDQVKKDVGDDGAKAYRALKAEREAEKPRVKLVDHLQKVIESAAAASLPAWVEKGATNANGARWQMPGSTIEVLAGTKAYKAKVRKFIEAHTDERGNARAYLTDGAPLHELVAALRAAAEERFDEQADYRKLIRSAVINERVAATADGFEPAADEPAADEVDEEATA